MKVRYAGSCRHEHTDDGRLSPRRPQTWVSSQIGHCGSPRRSSTSTLPGQRALPERRCEQHPRGCRIINDEKGSDTLQEVKEEFIEDSARVMTSGGASETSRTDATPCSCCQSRLQKQDCDGLIDALTQSDTNRDPRAEVLAETFRGR